MGSGFYTERTNGEHKTQAEKRTDVRSPSAALSPLRCVRPLCRLSGIRSASPSCSHFALLTAGRGASCSHAKRSHIESYLPSGGGEPAMSRRELSSVELEDGSPEMAALHSQVGHRSDTNARARASNHRIIPQRSSLDRGDGERRERNVVN